MRSQLVISEEAEYDLLSIYDYIAEDATPQRASRYIHRIEQFCLGLRTFSQRGRSMRGTSGEVRVIGFERRIAITFHIDKDKVVILRILYGGCDLDAILSSL